MTDRRTLLRSEGPRCIQCSAVKTVNDVDEVTLDGRLFHTREAATGKRGRQWWNGASTVRRVPTLTLTSTAVASLCPPDRHTVQFIGKTCWTPEGAIVECVKQNKLSDIRKPDGTLSLTVTVTVTVTKVFILRFLLEDRKCITKSFTYDQRRPD